MKALITRQVKDIALSFIWLGVCSSALQGQSTRPSPSIKERSLSSNTCVSSDSSKNVLERLHAQKALDESLSSIALAMPGQNEIVKGQPLSAEAVTETSIASPGSQLTKRRNVIRMDRDQEGRTRREQTVHAIAASVPIAPHRIIFIFDPVKARNFVIDPKERVVREFLVSPRSSDQEGDGVKLTSPHTPTSVIVKSLGQKRIGNLLCTGIRRTSSTTLGRKEAQWDEPTVTETWSSAELGLVVESWTHDPRFGSSHYFLRSISRSSPSPKLFAPPSTYKTEKIRSAK